MEMYLATDYRWETTRVAGFIRRHGYESLEDLLACSVSERRVFWARMLDELDVVWARPYDALVIEGREGCEEVWFAGGRLSLLDNLLRRRACRQPAQVALRWETDRGERVHRTYAQLLAEVCALASGMWRFGLARGDVIACWLPMGPETVAIWLAAAAIGAVVVPVAPSTDAAAVGRIVRAARARWLVCAATTLDACRECLAECPSVRRTVVVACGSQATPSSADGREIAYPDLCRGGVGASPEGVADADAPVFLTPAIDGAGEVTLTTHTHAGLLIKAGLDLAMAFDVHAGDVLYWAQTADWPMWPWLLMGSLLNGATLVIDTPGRIDPADESPWRAAARHRATHLGLAPATVARLMAGAVLPDGPDRLETVRLFATTGERWSEAQWLWLFDQVGHCRRPVVNMLGGMGFGGAVLVAYPGLPMKPCALDGPIPGVAIATCLDGGAGPGASVARHGWPGRPQTAPGSPRVALPVSMDADGFWFVSTA